MEGLFGWQQLNRQLMELALQWMPWKEQGMAHIEHNLLNGHLGMYFAGAGFDSLGGEDLLAMVLEL
jgi:hypothetical protein